MSSILLSRYLCKNPKSKISLFRFCVSEFCTITCITYAMLKILSDPIINQAIDSSVQINISLQFCFSISCFYQFATKSIQNKQNLEFRHTLHTNQGIALSCSSFRETIIMTFCLRFTLYKLKIMVCVRYILVPIWKFSLH